MVMPMTPEERKVKREALKRADEKFRRGDSLSDTELAGLAKAYWAASDALGMVYHASYSLVDDDLYKRVRDLEGFQKARRESRTRTVE